jgi:hypothetical protein
VSKLFARPKQFKEGAPNEIADEFFLAFFLSLLPMDFFIPEPADAVGKQKAGS